MTFLLPPIHIIGAGIAGLTLARCLRNKGIQAIIFEKNPSPAKHNYGVTLQPRTCRALVKVLGIDAHSFLRRIAVDRSIGGSGGLGSRDRLSTESEGLKSPFRAHCGRLEAVMGEDLKIEWGRVLENVSDGGVDHVLEFKDKERIHAEFILDTSGVHSRVRKALLAKSDFDILPYVVFRGTRRLDGSTFRETYRSSFQDTNVFETRKDDVLLQVWINDYKENLEIVDISYVYSRPTRENDLLHRPGRAPGESSDISESFFEEVTQLSNLDVPFKDVFDGEKIKKDRILHWLMRTSLTPLNELVDLSRKGVVFLGDAAHAMPILGGEGANFAIEDAVDLADYVAEKGVEGLKDFYMAKYEEWSSGLEQSIERLAEMHSLARSLL